MRRFCGVVMDAAADRVAVVKPQSGFFGSASCCTRSGLLLALSWPNLPCALKAAIGIGKRTLGRPAQALQSGAATGASRPRQMGPALTRRSPRGRIWRRPGRGQNRCTRFLRAARDLSAPRSVAPQRGEREAQGAEGHSLDLPRPDLTAVMPGWPENKIVRRVRLMVVHDRRNHPCRICSKRCHRLDQPVNCGRE